MSLKSKLEALIYAAEEPVGLDQMAALLKDDLLALKNAPAPESSAPDSSDPKATSDNSESHLGAVEADTGTPSTQAEDTAGEPATKKSAKEKSERVELRGLLKPILDELIASYQKEEHGIEIRQVANGYRMSTKPEHHDVVRSFAKSLKPPIRLSLQALETLAVIAYKQPVTVPEISEIRGVDSSGVIGTLLDRKLITTAGRKAVVGRPMLYKTTKDFLMRFGLRDLNELPSIEEFEKIAADQGDLFLTQDIPLADATGVPNVPEEQDSGIEQMAEDKSEAPQNVTEPTVSSDPHHDRTDEEAAGQVASESTGG